MFLVRLSLICVVMLVPVGFTELNSATPAAFTCPVTLPVDERPEPALDPFDPNAELFYEDGLWVTIPREGVIKLAPDDEITFGPLAGWRSEPVTWLREEGVEGFVEVTGKRLDEESDLHPQTPLSPQRQYVRAGQVTTGLAFPSEGCWEVSGSVASPLAGDKHSITFVVDVRFVDAPIATPEHQVVTHKK